MQRLRGRCLDRPRWHAGMPLNEKLRRSLIFVALAGGIVSAQAQDAATPPAPATENVTVTGLKDTEAAVSKFVGAMTVPTRAAGKLARWKEGRGVPAGGGRTARDREPADQTDQGCRSPGRRAGEQSRGLPPQYRGHIHHRAPGAARQYPHHASHPAGVLRQQRSGGKAGNHAHPDPVLVHHRDGGPARTGAGGWRTKRRRHHHHGHTTGGIRWA